jgi:hypothetical protein
MGWFDDLTRVFAGIGTFGTSELLRSKPFSGGGNWDLPLVGPVGGKGRSAFTPALTALGGVAVGAGLAGGASGFGAADAFTEEAVLKEGLAPGFGYQSPGFFDKAGSFFKGSFGNFNFGNLFAGFSLAKLTGGSATGSGGVPMPDFGKLSLPSLNLPSFNGVPADLFRNLPGAVAAPFAGSLEQSAHAAPAAAPKQAGMLGGLDGNALFLILSAVGLGIFLLTQKRR